MEKGSRYLSLVGRILLSSIFLLSALGKITGWSATAGYMASKGMPLVPFFLAAATLVELAGGLSLLTGFQARRGALAHAVAHQQLNGTAAATILGRVKALYPRRRFPR